MACSITPSRYHPFRTKTLVDWAPVGILGCWSLLWGLWGCPKVWPAPRTPHNVILLASARALTALYMVCLHWSTSWPPLSRTSTSGAVHRHVAGPTRPSSVVSTEARPPTEVARGHRESRTGHAAAVGAPKVPGVHAQTCAGSAEQNRPSDVKTGRILKDSLPISTITLNDSQVRLC